MTPKRDAIKATLIAVGKMIREHRKQMGWTQTQLGELIQVDQTTVSEWERGESLPGKQAKRLWAALQIPAERVIEVMTAAVQDRDEVEAALRGSALSPESRDAMITIYRKTLAADIAEQV